MNSVWGEEFMDRYNKWTTKWANTYEETGKKLPRLKISGNRTSGMRHFLGEITAYAAEKLTHEAFKKRMESRIVNGYTYAKGLGKTATDFLPEGKRYPGSIPSLFVDCAWEVLKNRELLEGIPEVSLFSNSQDTRGAN